MEFWHESVESKKSREEQMRTYLFEQPRHVLGETLQLSTPRVQFYKTQYLKLLVLSTAKFRSYVRASV